MTTFEEVLELAGPVGAREFFQAPEWAQQAAWAEIQAIPAMSAQQFVDAAEEAIMAEAILQRFRGNHAHKYAIVSAFYHQALLRHVAEGHDEHCRANLYRRAHARAMRSQGHIGGPIGCTCPQPVKSEDAVR